MHRSINRNRVSKQRPRNRVIAFFLVILMVVSNLSPSVFADTEAGTFTAYTGEQGAENSQPSDVPTGTAEESGASDSVVTDDGSGTDAEDGTGDGTATAPVDPTGAAGTTAEDVDGDTSSSSGTGSLLPQSGGFTPFALAPLANYNISLSNGPFSGTGYSLNNGILTFDSGANNNTYTITQNGTSQASAIRVSSGGTVNITIQGINVTSSAANVPAFQVEPGTTVNLTLAGNNYLTQTSTSTTMDHNNAALHVARTPGNNSTKATLVIGGSGSLTAKGGYGGAGIGGGNSSSSNNARNNGGNITINSGTITATGGALGAGIGGGRNGLGGDITINGGTITATGGDPNGAGIGGGQRGQGGNITIKGGTITATGNNNGAGIGGGGADTGINGGPSGNIKITGGTITANGGGYISSIPQSANIQATGGGAGIGPGHPESGTNDTENPDSNIHISGGTIVATGGPGGTLGASDWGNRPGAGVGGYKSAINIEPSANIVAFSRGGGPILGNRENGVKPPYTPFPKGQYVSPTFAHNDALSIASWVNIYPEPITLFVYPGTGKQGNTYTVSNSIGRTIKVPAGYLCIAYTTGSTSQRYDKVYAYNSRLSAPVQVEQVSKMDWTPLLASNTIPYPVAKLNLQSTLPMPKVTVSYQKSDGSALSGGQAELIVPTFLGGSGAFTTTSNPKLIIPDFSSQNLKLSNWKLDGVMQNNTNPGITGVDKDHSIVLVYQVPQAAPATVTKYFQTQSGTTIKNPTSVSVQANTVFSAAPDNIPNYRYLGHKIGNGSLQSGNPYFQVASGASYQVTYVYEVASSTVTKQFQDKSGTTLKPSTSVSVQPGGIFSDAPDTIPNYLYLGYRIGSGSLQSGNPSLQVASGVNYQVTYVYEQSSSTVTKQFQDKFGESLIPNETVGVQAGAIFADAPRDIPD
ncbi:MAG: carbohydrate-binding domain-containing protein, partial [Coriobacteriales bacterium]|nr:carbohydrate-binding domain-containing protein [Coriobacteriales bacterium]